METSAFFAAPSADSLKTLTKDQVAEHYGFELDIPNPKSMKKDDLVKLVMERQSERDEISFSSLPDPVKPTRTAAPHGSGAVSVAHTLTSAFTFEQQMKLLEMQLERDKLMARKREKDRALEYSKVRQTVGRGESAGWRSGNFTLSATK